MKYFSTFTGIGGFELGIQLAYEGNNRGQETNNKGGGAEVLLGRDVSDPERLDVERPLPSCVGYSEIDKYASAIYQSHFPEHKNHGDITKINADTLPDFDLLVGGFPCQSFSIAGKRGGFEDTRGTLFFDLARILRAKRPRLFLFENVKGLLSHDNGRTFSTIISTLDELGYDLQWQVLNSKNHGVPQNRERIFIIGHLRGTSRPKVFPFTESTGNDIEVVGELSSETWTKRNESTRRVYGIDGVSPTIPTAQEGGVMAKIIKVSGDLDKRKTYLGDIASTLAANPTSDNTARLYEEGKIRRLTPTECERLQGFPDGWTEGVSDTQRYKCCGNAVTVNVIRDIAEKLLTPIEPEI